MTTEILTNADGSMTLSVSFSPGASMMESGLKLQSALNELGAEATGECLKRFDTDGAKIEIGGCKFTSKGAQPKTYQTPYREARSVRSGWRKPVTGSSTKPERLPP